MNKNKKLRGMIALLLGIFSSSFGIFAMSPTTSMSSTTSPLPLKIVNKKIDGNDAVFTWEHHRPFWALKESSLGISPYHGVASPKIYLTPKCEYFFNVIESILTMVRNSSFDGKIKSILISECVLDLFERRYGGLMQRDLFFSCCITQNFFMKVSSRNPISFEDRYKELLNKNGIQNEGAEFYPAIILHLSEKNHEKAQGLCQSIADVLITVNDESFESMLQTEPLLVHNQEM